MKSEAELANLLADHLEPWWRCVHTPRPMGATMECHECRACESERTQVGAALAYAACSVGVNGFGNRTAVSHVLHAVADILPALTEGPDRIGTARWPESDRNAYSLAIEDAQSALRARADALD